MRNSDSRSSVETFESRHIGLNEDEKSELLKSVGVNSIDALIEKTIPAGIRLKAPLKLAKPLSEAEAIAAIRAVADKNQVYRSFIGMGYVDTRVPAVILRNILENPGWYTQYTPYQAEIAQGRLEALLNFQTMVMDFTGFEIANASLLDEGTAAAEAMAMSFAVQGKDHAKAYFVAADCHPQTIAVIQTRAKYLGIKTLVGNPATFDFKTPIFGALLQYPNTFGEIHDLGGWIKRAHDGQALVTLACDLMALVLLRSPGELGADFAVGNTQCFGVPMGFGGPHAAFLSTKDAYKRQMPGRIVGVSKDALGKPAIRLALQTREQHIRRDKATSNICTAQVLLAIMASMYAVYHGPKGVREIAQKIHRMTGILATGLRQIGFQVGDSFFNTLTVRGGDVARIHALADTRKMNFRPIDGDAIGITLDETATPEDLAAILNVFGEAKGKQVSVAEVSSVPVSGIPNSAMRTTAFLTHPVFNRHHSETEMLRYITRLQAKICRLRIQ